MPQTALDIIADPRLFPYMAAFAAATGMFLLELGLVLAGLGGASTGDGAGAAGPEMDVGAVDPELDTGAGDGAESGVQSAPDAGPQVDAAGSVLARRQVGALRRAGAGAARGALGWLRLDRGPLLIWMAGACVGFACAGVAGTLWAGFLPASAVLLLSCVVGLQAGRGAASFWGALVPTDESSAIRRSSFHNRQGVVVLGVARRGAPAQVRLRDGHGNLHYLLAEPLQDDDVIEEGVAVSIIRAADGRWTLRALET